MDMNLNKQSTGKLSVLQSTGSQRVGHDLATEKQQLLTLRSSLISGALRKLRFHCKKQGKLR